VLCSLKTSTALNNKSCYARAFKPGVEPATSWLQEQCPTRDTTTLPYQHSWPQIPNIIIIIGRSNFCNINQTENLCSIGKFYLLYCLVEFFQRHFVNICSNRSVEKCQRHDSVWNISAVTRWVSSFILHSQTDSRRKDIGAFYPAHLHQYSMTKEPNMELIVQENTSLQILRLSTNSRILTNFKTADQFYSLSTQQNIRCNVYTDCNVLTVALQFF